MGALVLHKKAKSQAIFQLRIRILHNLLHLLPAPLLFRI